MTNTVIKIENLSKLYRLGEVGTGSLREDINRWWTTTIRGEEDPYAQIGHVNDQSEQAEIGEYIWALRDVNLEVQEGEVLGIIGKNGAGKSTLLKLLSQVTSPTTGVVKTKGRLATLLEVGTGFHPEMTGRENIFMNGTIMGMRRLEIARKLDEIVEFAGVAKYMDTPVKRYSSGMRVRLGFAVAAFLEPEILVVDEVLAVGDAEFQKKAIGKMKDVSQGEGRTVLFVSHNMNSIRSLCSRGLLLENGTVKFVGEVDSIISSYLSLNSEIINNLLSPDVQRNGSGEMRFTNIYFKNNESKVVDQIISGDYLEIHIELEKYSDIDFTKLIFSILFRDNGGNTVLQFVTDEMEVTIEKIDLKGKVIIKIPNIWLRGNNYNLAIRLNKDGITGQKFVVDEINNATVLRVIEGDIWNIGRSNRPGAFAVIPSEISIMNDND